MSNNIYDDENVSYINKFKNQCTKKNVALLLWVTFVCSFIYFISLFPSEVVIDSLCEELIPKPSISGFGIIAIYIFGGSGGFYYFEILCKIGVDEDKFWNKQVIGFSFLIVGLGLVAFSGILLGVSYSHPGYILVAVSFILGTATFCLGVNNVDISLKKMKNEPVIKNEDAHFNE